jgi:Circularly permutated YpsA SLOG family
MIKLVISGGQTGADQAGWRAAQACGIETGGWMPQYFQTETGPNGSLGRLYNVKTSPTPSCRARTFCNVRESDGTILFGTTDTSGAKATLEACDVWRKPVFLVEPYRSILPSDVVLWLRQNPQIEVLDIAGNRGTKSSGIGERVERFLKVDFKRVKKQAQS